jgi:hypothetical protein
MTTGRARGADADARRERRWRIIAEAVEGLGRLMPDGAGGDDTRVVRVSLLDWIDVASVSHPVSSPESSIDVVCGPDSVYHLVAMATFRLQPFLGNLARRSPSDALTLDRVRFRAEVVARCVTGKPSHDRWVSVDFVLMPRKAGDLPVNDSVTTSVIRPVALDHRWTEDASLVHDFGSWLVAYGTLATTRDVLDYFGRPHRWTPERDRWIAAGRPEPDAAAEDLFDPGAEVDA